MERDLYSLKVQVTQPEEKPMKKNNVIQIKVQNQVDPRFAKATLIVKDFLISFRVSAQK